MENPIIVDQRLRAIRQFIVEHRDILARQGTIVATWRRRGARKLGPYYLLVARDRDGVQRSVYLGPPSAIIEEVRGELVAIQLPHQEGRQLARARRQLQTGLARAKRQLDLELAANGFSRHGNEFRGWSGQAAARGKHGCGSILLPAS